MRASASDLEAAELIPIQENIGQVVLQNHFQEVIARSGDCPTILVMCREWASAICESREELVEVLNFLGKCGHNVEELWDYNDRTTTNAEITRLFDVCYERKSEEITAAAEPLMVF